jgi:hypothetical protein
MAISGINAFRLGIKPTFLCTTLQERFMQKHFANLSDYPYTTVEILPEDQHQCFLFFQKEEMKQEFLHKTFGLEKDHPELHKQIGLVLGYPPRAVEFFYKNKLDKLDREGISLSYVGGSCIMDIDDLIENAIWYWNQYQFHDEMLVGYAAPIDGYYKRISIPYLDHQQLKRVYHTIKAKLQTKAHASFL